MRGHAEIVGAGFAGLTAAAALLRQGWTVRVHERSASLRSEGFGIAIQENGLRTLDALGIGEQIRSKAVNIVRRVICDAKGNIASDLALSRSPIRVSRRDVIDAMSDIITAQGGDIVTRSEIAEVAADGTVKGSDGRSYRGDVVIGADGINSRIRDSLGVPVRRILSSDGAMRLVIPRADNHRSAEGTTYEHWSGARRLICSPCSPTELYIALSSPASDTASRTVPFDRTSWSASFPHLTGLFDRMAAHADWSGVLWSQFQTIRLSSWRADNVAFVGDAAHAMTPNLGQGGGCAMMNAFSLAQSLASAGDVPTALTDWEARERPLIEHTQLWSRIYGAVTRLPESVRSLALKAAARPGWLQTQLQRAAGHVPYGSVPFPSSGGMQQGVHK